MNPMITAIQISAGTLSFSIGAESATTKNGPAKLIASTSASGSSDSEPTNRSVEQIINIDLSAWRPGRLVRISARNPGRHAATRRIPTLAKKNRAQTTSATG